MLRTLLKVAGMFLVFMVATAEAASIDTPLVHIRFPGAADALWSYSSNKGGAPLRLAPPQFPIDGKLISGAVTKLEPVGAKVELPNGVTEQHFRGALRDSKDFELEIVFRTSKRSPIIRFKYRLLAKQPHTLRHVAQGADLSYFSVSLRDLPETREVRLSEFVDLFHAYTPHEEAVEARHYAASAAVMGPLFTAADSKRSVILAYEHGSTIPNAFLSYRLAPDRRVTLEATKANYLPGQIVDANHPFETLWFEIGSVAGGQDALAAAFREFVLHDLALTGGTRRPSIFYNTWNVQERRRLREKTHMGTINTEFILRDIEVAHKMGVEVFVIDTGWFVNSGDWDVSLKRFPDGLSKIRKQLADYGMQLGLWFDPVMAAVGSKSFKENQGNVASVRGKIRKENVWESGDSVGMCLASAWADTFADRLVQLGRDLGVKYFKLDGLQTDACDAPGHNHGDSFASADERLQSYAFQLPQALTHIAEKVIAADPEAIVDLDMTEDGRIMGLEFLTAGKYFLINNGPYYSDFDVPRTQWGETANLFFSPGPARGWITRAPLTYDRWLPSVLFLIHFFPDNPMGSQMINLGTLILGGQGLWGDLQAVSPDGVALIGEVLSHYKQVRNDMTGIAAHRTGALAGSPEVYEKIAKDTGRGAVVMFTTSGPRHYEFITRARPDKAVWTKGAGATVTFDKDGHAHINADLKKNETVIVFFGAR